MCVYIEERATIRGDRVAVECTRTCCTDMTCITMAAAGLQVALEGSSNNLYVLKGPALENVDSTYIAKREREKRQGLVYTTFVRRGYSESCSRVDQTPELHT